MPMPLPPGHNLPPPKPKVEHDEVHLILKQCLRPDHHENPNVLRFINEYLMCRDPRQAAREIGLDPKIGIKMRNQPDIYMAITKITERAAMKYGYDAAELVERTKEIAMVDPGDLENDDGSFIESLKKMPPELRRALKKLKVRNEYSEDPNGVKFVTGKVLEYEFWDKMVAIKMLGSEKDIFKETKKIEHDIGKNMSNTLLESKKKADERVAQLRDVSPEKREES